MELRLLCDRPPAVAADRLVDLSRQADRLFHCVHSLDPPKMLVLKTL
jgi:hypothetical protein